MVNDITPTELALSLQSGDWHVLDVREDWERDIVALAQSINIPLGEIPQRVSEIPTNKNLAVLCHGGVRSAQAAAFLVSAGLPQVYNVVGGIDRWAIDVEPDLPRY
ncbi:MAG: rhodanese-like domain-containing protein [Pseudomonadota bacterium]